MQCGLFQHFLFFVTIFMLFLSGDTIHFCQHIAYGKLNRNTVGLFQLHCILQSLRALGKKLLGRLADI